MYSRSARSSAYRDGASRFAPLLLARSPSAAETVPPPDRRNGHKSERAKRLFSCDEQRNAFFTAPLAFDSVAASERSEATLRIKILDFNTFFFFSISTHFSSSSLLGSSALCKAPSSVNSKTYILLLRLFPSIDEDAHAAGIHTLREPKKRRRGKREHKVKHSAVWWYVEAQRAKHSESK